MTSCHCRFCTSYNYYIFQICTIIVLRIGKELFILLLKLICPNYKICKIIDISSGYSITRRNRFNCDKSLQQLYNILFSSFIRWIIERYFIFYSIPNSFKQHEIKWSDQFSLTNFFNSSKLFLLNLGSFILNKKY